jgi:hypothetical protein
MMLCCAPGCYFRNVTDYGGVPLCPPHFAAVAALVPPPEPPRPQPVVYYLERIDRPGQIKIGTTGDLRKRLQDIGSRGRTVTLLATEPGGVAIERKRHAQFAEMRLDGEWFSAAGPLTRYVEHLARAVAATG